MQTKCTTVFVTVHKIEVEMQIWEYHCTQTKPAHLSSMVKLFSSTELKTKLAFLSRYVIILVVM